MSVINQMLKDLDKRQESGVVSGQSVVPNSAVSKSPLIPIIITVLVTLTLVAVAFLYFENQELKQKSQLIVEKPVMIGKAEVKTAETQKIATQPAKSKQLELSSNESEKSIALGINSADTEKVVLLENHTQPNTIHTAQQEKVPAQLVAASATSSLGKVVQSNIKRKVNEVSTTNQLVQQKVEQSKQTSLSISRKKLSPAELAAKKMTQAEQAMLNKNIELAEQYFEEILIISPTHASARKQLAALLYGRQSIQEAINILSQGIHITPNNSELRLMLARVYSEKGFNQQALNTLTPLADTLDVAYQSAIATSAQSLSAHQEAINAFSHLVNLQQGQSRWYLGLAVSYDRLGQYPQAVDAYQQAILIGNLSESALSFAKQRTLELGES